MSKLGPELSKIDFEVQAQIKKSELNQSPKLGPRQAQAQKSGPLTGGTHLSVIQQNKVKISEI